MELLGGQNFFPRSQMSESFDLPAGCGNIYGIIRVKTVLYLVNTFRFVFFMLKSEVPTYYFE